MGEFVSRLIDAARGVSVDGAEELLHLQWAVGSGKWAVGSGQWAVGSGQ